MLGAGLSASCRMASPGSSTLNMVSYGGVGNIGVATLGVDLRAMFRMACLWSSASTIVLFSTSQRQSSSRGLSLLNFDLSLRLDDRHPNARLRLSDVVSKGIPTFMWAKYGIFCRRREDRRRDARRWFACIVSYGVSSLFAFFGILCWRRYNRCDDARRPRGLWPLSCNLLTKTNNFGFGAVLLSCLVFELQEQPSQGVELRTVFRSFDHPMFFSWFQRINMPMQIGFPFSRF
jgi:hypothetical protein